MPYPNIITGGAPGSMTNQNPNENPLRQRKRV